MKRKFLCNFYEKVNLYMVFTNKMIKLNQKKNYAKNNFFLSLKSVSNKEATSF